MSTIFLSLGHNNALNVLTRDQGATADGFTEFAICRDVRKFFSARYKGNDTIVFVPENLSLTARIAWINKRAIDGDIAIELHMNAGVATATGTEVFYYAGSQYMRNIASRFSASLAKSLSLKDRGAKEDTATRHGRLGFIRETKPIAILVELGFITNKRDRQMVIERGSSSLANAMKEVFG